MKAFIAAFIIIFALVTLPVPFPEYVTGPIKLFLLLLVSTVTMIILMRKTPHERMQERLAESRKQYRGKPDPYLLGIDAARHHADFTLSRKEILFQCNREANKYSPEDAKEFMRGVHHYIKTAFADPVNIEIS